MNKFFTIIEGEAAVLASKGIYYQVDLYSRGRQLYAKRGSGFIRMMANGDTSKPDVRWDFMSVTPAKTDELGRLWI